MTSLSSYFCCLKILFYYLFIKFAKQFHFLKAFRFNSFIYFHESAVQLLNQKKIYQNDPILHIIVFQNFAFYFKLNFHFTYLCFISILLFFIEHLIYDFLFIIIINFIFLLIKDFY